MSDNGRGWGVFPIRGRRYFFGDTNTVIMEKKQKVTLQDIADRVGVTKGLVSLALSGKYGVGEEMRNRILLTAAEMGYQIEKTRSFIKNMKRTALLVSHQELHNQTFWNQIINGIQMFSYDNNIAVNYINIEDYADNNELISKILETRAGGVIALGDLSNDVIQHLLVNAIPAVVIDSRHYFGSEIDHVKVNNFDGGYKIADYALAKGHRDILFIGDTSFALSFFERYNGFRRRIEEQSDAVCRYAMSAGVEELDTYNVKEVAGMLDERKPTLIMCVNDSTARTVYDEIKGRGWSIPKDVSVVSFDASLESERLEPTLTGVNFSKSALGEEACAMLEERKRGKRAYSRTILLPVNIDEKNSVKDISR